MFDFDIRITLPQQVYEIFKARVDEFFWTTDSYYEDDTLIHIFHMDGSAEEYVNDKSKHKKAMALIEEIYGYMANPKKEEEPQKEYTVTKAGICEGKLSQEEIDQIDSAWAEYVAEYNSCHLFD